MIGILPDETELTTEVLEIELDCPEEAGAFARDGGPAEIGGVGDARRRAGREDAASREPESENGDGGCSVSSAGACFAKPSESALLGLLVWAGAAVVVRRGRRRRRWLRLAGLRDPAR